MSGKLKPVETVEAVAKDGVAKTLTATEKMMAFSQGNLDAMVKASQIWTAGMQDIGQLWASSAQSAMDETVNVFKQISSVKTLQDAMALQSTLARSSVDRALDQTGKLTKKSADLVEQTMAPITARVEIAVETFGKPTFLN